MLLSIIIPTYNRVDFLDNTLYSIVKQIIFYNLENTLEILISNNNSTDSTDNLITFYKIKYPDIHFIYFKNDKNIGGVKNFLKLLDNINGSYWYFIGDDDLLADNCLLDVLNCLNENNNVPIFIFNQQNNIISFENKLITIEECANKYFYYMGNLCTIAKSISTKYLLNKYYNDLIKTPWPQTYIYFLLMILSNKQFPVYISKIIIYDIQKKENNNISNAYYHFDSQFYSLAKLSYLINEASPKKIFKNFTTGVPYLQNFKFFKFAFFTVTAQFKLFDTKKENLDYIETLNNAFKDLKVKEKLLLFWFYLFLLLPKSIYRHIYAFFNMFKTKNFKYFPDFTNYNTSLKIIEKKIQLKNNDILSKHSVIINKGEW